MTIEKGNFKDPKKNHMEVGCEDPLIHKCQGSVMCLDLFSSLLLLFNMNF